MPYAGVRVSSASVDDDTLGDLRHVVALASIVPRPPVAMVDYLHEQTIGGMLRNTFRIFFSHFPMLYLISSAPLIPLAVLNIHAQHAHNRNVASVALLSNLIVGVIIAPAIAVAVSDICVAAHPRFLRSYRRGLGTAPFGIIGTALVLGLAPVAGAGVLGAAAASWRVPPVVVLAIVLAGVVAAVWIWTRYLLIFPVMVIESIWGRRAAKRASLLTRDYSVRNLCVVSFCGVVALTLHMLIVAPVAVALLNSRVDDEVAALLLGVLSNAFAALYSIPTMLLYYDMRIKKEAFDVTALLADLN
jgi:hypothetical protein